MIFFIVFVELHPVGKLIRLFCGHTVSSKTSHTRTFVRFKLGGGQRRYSGLVETSFSDCPVFKAADPYYISPKRSLFVTKPFLELLDARDATVGVF